MRILKACRVCFSTNVKCLIAINQVLRTSFNLLTGLKSSSTDGMPQYLCLHCDAYLKKLKKFRDHCYVADYALRQLLKKNHEIREIHLQGFNLKSVGGGPMLSYLDYNHSQYDITQLEWVNNGARAVRGDSAPDVHYSISSHNCAPPPSQPEKLSDTMIKLETDDAINIDVEADLNDNNGDKSILKSILQQAFDESGNDFDHDFPVSDNDDVPIGSKDAEGSKFDEEYAYIIPITTDEAMAAAEVNKAYGTGKLRCNVCNKPFGNAQRLQIHMRMHDKHVSGNHFCEICQYYYKTEFLLKTHMTDKHNFKYVCKSCTEVSFCRASAKQHYIQTHLRKCRKEVDWYEKRPRWLSSKGGRRIKRAAVKKSRVPDRMKGEVLSVVPVRKIVKLPEDFPIYQPIKHEEQYEMIRERKNSRNYMEAKYKCELCFRGFRLMGPYHNHIKKHDPEISGRYMCDMCQLYFISPRKMYKHMIITHLFKFSCQLCKYVCTNRGQAHTHYRWHKNVTYQCPHCDKEFKKLSTRLTHVRIKHPSMFICNICGHSFVSDTGLYCHKRIAHSKEEIEKSHEVTATPGDPCYCADCQIQFMSDDAFQTHLGSSNKHSSINKSITRPRSNHVPRRVGRPRNSNADIVNNGMPTAHYCEVCNKFLTNDVQARKHYESEHPGTEFLKRYMCDVCGHTTRQYANLMVHMRTHTNEKPYGCPHCERRFSMPSNRDRHIVVHTGEKRYQCQHCSRRFTQSSAVKLHIQTVHLKIPYAPWDKKNRRRRKEMEAPGLAAAVAPVEFQPPQQKMLLEAQGDYLNAYINYNDDV